jgi:oligopeptide/dipeptide ABC transporter ATP-binding protein
MTRSAPAPQGRDATPEAAAPVLLDVKDLRVRLRSGTRVIHAVNGVSYRLRQRHTLAIIGESGSGKTISARALMGLLPEGASVSGSVRLQGTELLGLPDRRLRRVRGPGLSMVFQDPGLSLSPTMRIGLQVAETIRAHAETSRRDAQRRAVELLDLVRIPDASRRAHEYPHQLSGGMRQRVMIAIALACAPKVLIADEATTALDVTTQAQIMELIVDLKEELGTTVILISHDLGLAAEYADEILVMYAGQIVERAPAERLFGNVRMPYTRALRDAIPQIERPPHSPLPAIEGRPPDMARLSAGCPFAPRCPYATGRCREAAPPLVEHEPSHHWACWHPQGD